MRNAVICGYVRSPFCFANKGELIKVRPDDLLASVIKGLLAKTTINPQDIEDVIVGCSFPEGEQGMNIARTAVLLADLPISIAGTTVNRFCGSSMTSIHMAAGNITSNAGDVFICAGVESMSRVPMGGFNPLPNPTLYEKREGAYMSMGETAENVAQHYNITREQQDQFAVISQQKTAQAHAAGKLKDEIIPIDVRGLTVEKDGCIRPETTIAILNGLRPAFDEKGSVTAGTSSPLTDGAAAVLVCSEDYAPTTQYSHACPYKKLCGMWL